MNRQIIISISLKALFVIVLIPVIFSGCKKPNYVLLSEEDLAWVVYRNNDSMRFVVSSGTAFTSFKAQDNKRYYQHEGNNYYEGTVITIKPKISGSDAEGAILVQTGQGSTTATLSWPFYYGSVVISSLPLVTDTFSGKIYSDLIIAHSAQPSATNYIKTLYYSKTAGLVRFDDIYNQYWTIKN